ncbi:MAG: 2-oxoglutarate dehydrogenase E1 component [Hyphomicrobiaceae bacterium]|nr:MAG: 2-oxoglutarate dehydrogenase E1 component [Hyphomicrobiaceae bacterium]
MNRPMRPDDIDGTFVGGGDPGALEACFAPSPGEAAAARRSLAPLSSSIEAALAAAYRTHGYLRARLDPLGLAPVADVPELDPRQHGIDPAAIRGRIAELEAAYCGSIGWDIGHIHDRAQRRWLEAQAESAPPALPAAERVAMLAHLARAHAFEQGLTTRIPAGKLFGLGGAESFIVLLEALLAQSVGLGVEEAVVGGMHRGRFNMLATVMGKPLTALIAEILGKPAVPEGLGISSDVSYHLGYSGERMVASRKLRLSVSPHPSHLQIVPIIAQGRARAKQSRRGENGRRTVLPLLLHTDASFAGQGLVAEMLQLSKLSPFDLGGTIHIIINNQVGFTTNPSDGRSARHPTDIARLIEAPVLHVNGDDPDAVHRVACVAAAYRAAFGADILIDLVCYRRPGHNEIDEPRFTQPLLYRAIDARSPVHELYARSLEADGIDTGPAMQAATGLADEMRTAFAAAKSYQVNHADWFDGIWSGLGAGTEADMLAFTQTGLPFETLRHLGHAITAVPEGLTIDPKVARFLDDRRRTIDAGAGIAWAAGEALALASLLNEGTPVRLGGQDSVRGTFTQRHLELHDQTTGVRHLVLAPIAARAGAAAEIHNTPLIENAVLTYEYGISLADPHRLVVWEAQFGEFLNVAQAVFDQCVACGEDRWLRASGLVILLPHGLDGGGPDHSTGRPERLLAACAGANIQIVNASTPANFFHALRRQMHRPFRKPLVVLSPKALLRHKACVSRLEEFGAGTGFRTVIADGSVQDARRVVLCTGKVFYELHAARAERGLDADVALVRIEQLHPFPMEAVRHALAAHPRAEMVWCEEEPENMGYFTHLGRRLEATAGRPVRRAGRPAAATPAVGVKYWHEAQVRAYLDDALGQKPSRTLSEAPLGRDGIANALLPTGERGP